MPKKIVAVIDEDQELIGALCAVLDLEQYDCIPHTSADGAVAMVQATQPDLIVLEPWLEERRAGEHVLADLQANPATSHIPLLICTGDTDYLDEIAPTLRARGIPVLAKPFAVPDLLSLVHHLTNDPGKTQVPEGDKAAGDD